MDTLKAVGPALKSLRKSAGLTQQQLADLARVGFSMISGYERGTEMPQLATLVRLLDAMRLDFFAFSAALDEQLGRTAPFRPGVARSSWVALLARNGIEPRVLEGAALAARMEANGAADLVASAIEAARQIAEAALAEVRRAELSLVAESPSEYDAGKGTKR